MKLRKRPNNGFHDLACVVICSLVGMGSLVARSTGDPKLVVGIVVDQLRSDYLESLQGLFGTGGFNRLLKEGVYLPDVEFHVAGLDPASASAIIQTGNYPRYNGITSSKVYSPTAKDLVFALHDPAAMGNFTTETFSPANLRLSTITDEFIMSGEGDNKAYSISPNAQQSIIMAGHAGNSAFWINENTGNWATTTFYSDNPKILTQRNYSNPISSRLDTLRWSPLRAVPETEGLKKKKKNRKSANFLYNFPKNDRNVYRMFSSSPLGNTEVTNAAISYLEELQLGRRDKGADMLNIAYTAAPYPYADMGDNGQEVEDTYLRLDGELIKLFDALDRYVGMDNVLVYVSSTGYYEDGQTDEPAYKMPSGNFSVKRALSLLNSYLSALYGPADYIATYNNGHVYLNHKEIENKKLHLKEIAEISRDFLVRMSGVNDAFTMADIMSSTIPSMEGLRLGTDPKTGGDVILEFNAGWTITDDSRYPVENHVERSEIALTPAFFMGAGIQPEKIEETVDAVVIAPTVSRLLRIRSPNGVAAKPLTLKRN